MAEERLYKAEEMALMIGVSTPTLNIWYRWKRTHQDHELAKLLPDFIQSGPRQTRYWRQSDCWNLIQFKQSIPHGRNGILGETTQAYVRKTKGDK